MKKYLILIADGHTDINDKMYIQTISKNCSRAGLLRHAMSMRTVLFDRRHAEEVESYILLKLPIGLDEKDSVGYIRSTGLKVL